MTPEFQTERGVYGRWMVTVGDNGLLASTWLDDDGLPADPDIQVLYVYPAGATEPIVARLPPDSAFATSGAGAWMYPLPLDAAGRLAYRWEAHGAVHGLREGEVVVLPSEATGDTAPPVPDEPPPPTFSEGAPSGGDQGGSEPPPP